MLLEGDDAGGGQNIVLGTAGEGGEQHRPVLIEAGGDTVKRAQSAGQRAADGTVFVVLVGASDNRGDRQPAVGELGHAGVLIGPLDTEAEAVGILHFGDNRLHPAPAGGGYRAGRSPAQDRSSRPGAAGRSGALVWPWALTNDDFCRSRPPAWRFAHRSAVSC